MPQIFQKPLRLLSLVALFMSLSFSLFPIPTSAATFSKSQTITPKASPGYVNARNYNVSTGKMDSAVAFSKKHGEKGIIMDGPITATISGQTTTYTWYKIQWSDSKTGWSVESFLELVDTSARVVTSKYASTQCLKVRSYDTTTKKMNAEVLGQKCNGFGYDTIGLVQPDAPITTTIEGQTTSYKWIKIKWTDNLIGWSASDFVIDYPLFKDVSLSHGFARHVYNLKDAKVVGGYSDNTFRPDLSVNRGEMAKFVKNALFGNSTDTQCARFNDVSSGDAFYSEITTLKCKGVISGYSDGTFRPQSLVKRGEAAKFVVLGARIKKYGYDNRNFLKNTQTSQVFTDMPENSPLFNYVMSAYSNNIVSGTTSTTYSPEKYLNRGGMSKIVDNTRIRI